MKIKKSELIKLNESLKKWIRLTEGKESETREIVINKDWGGFTVTEKMKKWFKENGHKTSESYWDDRRDDPILVQCVKEVKPSDLKIVEIPSKAKWEIWNDDGIETVVEKGHYWK